jgi:hypothetical protein
MDTEKLPARLHELYPVDSVPLHEIPRDGEEDFYLLDRVADRILQKLNLVGIFFYSPLPSLKFFSRSTQEIISPHKSS